MKPGSAYGTTKAGKAKRARYGRARPKPPEHGKAASFIHHGETTNRDRLVRLYQNQSGTYTVDIEGLPTLTQSTPDRDKAEQIFRGWWEISMKDWGASEIDWGDW